MGGQNRQADRTAPSAWARRERRRRWLTGGLVAAGALAVIGLCVFLIRQELQPPPPLTGESIPIQSARHIALGESHEPYDSDPPTSGPHYAEAAKAGFYSEAPPDEQLVHNLEHGYVILWYSCTGLSDPECEDLQSDLRDVMNRAGNSPRTGTPKLIAVPRPSLTARIALTGWGWLDTLDSFDAERISNFIRAFRDRGPEPSAP